MDAVGDLLSTHFPNSERKPQLTVEQVTMDIQGLRRLVVSGVLTLPLVKFGCWGKPSPLPSPITV